MPRLAKGGKWVFGWVIVGQGSVICIPPEAYNEYGFQEGEAVILIHGSQRSGGLGIGRRERLSKAQVSFQSRIVSQARIGAQRRVVLSPESGVHPGECMLAVRGSSLAVGFLQRGPIYEEALKHPELETFS
jgi:hypothetical protein